MTSDRIQLASGITMPFYPMRPTRGMKCSPQQLAKDLKSGQWVIQPKLNGDRATLGVIARRKVVIQNRHLSMYKFTVKNSAEFGFLPAGTCLDGEVINGTFCPFEALALGNKLLLDSPVEFRVAQAERVCNEFGVPWMFPTPTSSWLESNINNKDWEGYVKKRSGSVYTIIGVESDSDQWFKCKWN